jgi:hypothetical protein
MSRFTSRDLMVSVLPGDDEAMAGPGDKTQCTTCTDCTNVTNQTRKPTKRSALSALQAQLAATRT